MTCRWVEYAGERFRVRLMFSGRVLVERLTWRAGCPFALGEDGKLIGTDGCRFAVDDPVLLVAQEFYDSSKAEREELDKGYQMQRYDSPYDFCHPPAVMYMSYANFNEHETITASLVWAPKMKKPRLEDTTMVFGLREKVLPAAIELAAADGAETWT